MAPKPTFWSVSLCGQPSSRYKFIEKSEMHQLTSKNQKCTNWPQIDLEHLMVKNTYSRDPHFGQFRPVARRFRDKVVENRKKSEMHGFNGRKVPHTRYISIPRPKFVPVLLYDQPFSRYKIQILSKYPRAQIWVSLALWPTIFEIQGCWKSEKFEIHTERTQNYFKLLSCQKYPVLLLAPEAKILVVSLYD